MSSLGRHQRSALIDAARAIVINAVADTKFYPIIKNGETNELPV